MSFLLLASGSPRRRQLLKALGLSFRIVKPRSLSESRRSGEKPEALVRRLAQAKAQEVANRYSSSWVLGADTVVALGSQVLGKPVNAEAGRKMLRALSGRTHRVLTGLALLGPGGTFRRIHEETTWVTFRRLTNRELDAYLKTKEPFDKAGGYAIQGTAADWVSEIRGDYFNVVGLPLEWLAAQTFRLGIRKKERRRCR